jgi:hypothetical protein
LLITINPNYIVNFNHKIIVIIDLLMAIENCKNRKNCENRGFWIVNLSQIHDKYVSDNPNPYPLFKMDWQSNHNPTIKILRAANIQWPCLMVKHLNSQETSFWQQHAVLKETFTHTPYTHPLKNGNRLFYCASKKISISNSNSN